MTSSPRNRKGFTLIELLTVIAIIGILAAVLFPGVQGVMKKAKQSAASTKLRNIAQSYIVFNSGSKFIKDAAWNTATAPTSATTLPQFAAMRRGIWIACILALVLGAPVALLSPWLLLAGFLAIACALAYTLGPSSGAMCGPSIWIPATIAATSGCCAHASRIVLKAAISRASGAVMSVGRKVVTPTLSIAWQRAWTVATSSVSPLRSWPA